MPAQPRSRGSTRVFISATSRELGPVRKLVKEALDALDIHGVEQTTFPLDYREIREKLRSIISSCDAMIHIAGLHYGAEPARKPINAPRRSFTQLEYDIAKELGIPVYVFVTGPGFAMEGLEPEAPELQDLQQQHRQFLTAAGQDYFVADSETALDRMVRTLRVRLDAIETELREKEKALDRLEHRIGEMRSLPEDAMRYLGKEYLICVPVVAAVLGILQVTGGLDAISPRLATATASLHPDRTLTSLYAIDWPRFMVQGAMAFWLACLWMFGRGLLRRRPTAFEAISMLLMLLAGPLMGPALVALLLLSAVLLAWATGSEFRSALATISDGYTYAGWLIAPFIVCWLVAGHLHKMELRRLGLPTR